MRNPISSSRMLAVVVAASASGALAQGVSTEVVRDTRERVNERTEEAAGRGVEAIADDSEVPVRDDGYGGNTNDGGAELPGAAPEAYLVKPGDTLWTLSQRFLNNPWYWPKVWSYNQQFDNPNWIYPGSTVRFYPGAAPVEVNDAEEPAFENVDMGGFEAGRLNDYSASLASRRRTFFVPADQLNEAGVVLNSPEEKQMLSINDRTYMQLRQRGNPGDTYQLYRSMRDLYHPVTKAKLGSIVELVGESRLDQNGDGQSLGTIVAAWNSIERGDRIGQLPVEVENVSVVPNTKAVKGYLVDAGPLTRNYMGENFIVIVDKGSSDGVAAGNIFTFTKKLDGFTKESTGLIEEDVGQAIVIEVNKTTSTALVMRTSRELTPGLRAEMRLP
jgi:LysM domain